MTVMKYMGTEIVLMSYMRLIGRCVKGNLSIRVTFSLIIPSLCMLFIDINRQLSESGRICMSKEY